MKTLQLTILLLTAIGMAFATSCATTRGFGQDLQKVGSKLEREADSTGGAAPVSDTGSYGNAPPSSIPSAY